MKNFSHVQEKWIMKAIEGIRKRIKISLIGQYMIMYFLTMLYLYESFKQIHEVRMKVTLRRLCIFICTVEKK